MTRSSSERLTQTKKRLEAYYDRELYMLSKDGVMSYGIGSRNVQRYNTELGEVRKAIKDLEEKVEYLESRAKGCSARKTVGVIPRDY